MNLLLFQPHIPGTHILESMDTPQWQVEVGWERSSVELKQHFAADIVCPRIPVLHPMAHRPDCKTCEVGTDDYMSL